MLGSQKHQTPAENETPHKIEIHRHFTAAMVNEDFLGNKVSADFLFFFRMSEILSKWPLIYNARGSLVFSTINRNAEFWGFFQQ